MRVFVHGKFLRGFFDRGLKYTCKKGGFDLVLLPDYFCSFRYLVKSSRPFLSHDNHSANLVSVAMLFSFAFNDVDGA